MSGSVMRIVLVFPVFCESKQPLRKSAVSAGDLFPADLAVSLRYFFCKKYTSLKDLNIDNLR